MKQLFILALLIVCVAIAGCSSSIIDNKPVSKVPDADLDELFEQSLPGPSLPPAEKPDDIICTEYTDRGLLRICYKSKAQAKLKLRVSFNDESNTFIDYNLKGDGSIEDFSLQFGSGSYTAQIWQNIKDKNYFAVETKSFSVELSDENYVYLNSVQNVNWNYDMKPIKDVRYIVADSLNEKDGDLLYSCGVDIYGYIVNHIKYDENKIFDLQHDYLPDIEQIYSEETGICYDYASLFASMLRSINIPAKLVKGYAHYSPAVYHAWNEVYVNGDWIVVDITRDASLLASGAPFEVTKNAEDYTKVNEY